MDHLVAIVGPTGIGKSKLALNLAHSFSGEIINADSRQLVRYLDIGTAKVTPEERSLVPHHLVDLIEPHADFSLALYQRLVYQTIADIYKRQKIPFLVGGSGQYVWSILENWNIPSIPPDPKFRRKLEKKALESGISSLYDELSRIDPASAKKIDRHNLRRIIRALEVYQNTNTPISELQYKKLSRFQSLIIGLTVERGELYRRVDQRVDEMITLGFINEVKDLISRGYDLGLPAMSGIGYRQIGRYLKGQCSLEAAKKEIKFETHRFIRKQYGWFRLKDARIRWFNIRQPGVEVEIRSLVTTFLGGDLAREK